MVKNTKTRIASEWNITVLRNKKILNLCLRWHILRNDHFAVEVTFKLRFLFVISGSGCVLISAFASFFCVHFGITSSAVGIKIFLITAGIIKYKSVIKKKHGKIVLLEKAKLDTIKVLISKALINSNIIHDEFVTVNNVLREYNEVREEIKNAGTSVEYTIQICSI